MGRPLLLAIVLATGCAYEWRHQRYGSPAAPGAAPIPPDPTPWIGDGIKGSTRWASPVAARLPIDGATILVTACNLYERTYVQMIVPPFVPYWSTISPSRPLVVGLGLEGKGTWRVDLRRVRLARGDVRVSVDRWSADRYGIDERLGQQALELCRRRPAPDLAIEERPVEIAGPSTLWLAFDVDPDPTVPAMLEVERVSLEGDGVSGPADCARARLAPVRVSERAIGVDIPATPADFTGGSFDVDSGGRWRDALAATAGGAA